MSLTKTNYSSRLVDDKVENYLKLFGAVSIEGPKWCGKTWTSLNHANTVYYLDKDEVIDLALLNVKYLYNGEYPILIDEWNLLPKVWDATRRICDEDNVKGKVILTCSTKLKDDKSKKKVKHSGSGRIGKILMSTMSLYESGESTGKVSLTDLYNGKVKDVDKNENITLEELAYYIVRGGWPGNLNVDEKNAHIIPNSYIENLLEKDINDDKNRDSNKMLTLLRSLARNESSIASNKTLLNNMDEENNIESRVTLDDYLDVLTRLHVVNDQKAYSSNYRSRERLGKSSKRHLVDPSLVCALLNLNTEKLFKDLNTFGLLFESLVYRDLSVYMNYLDGKVYHFRDNVSGLEVDSILEFFDGEYAAVEVKLSLNDVEQAKKNLIKFSNLMIKKPKFMCIIVGYTDAIIKDEETGIYIIPITALKP